MERKGEGIHRKKKESKEIGNDTKDAWRGNNENKHAEDARNSDMFLPRSRRCIVSFLPCLARERQPHLPGRDGPT